MSPARSARSPPGTGPTATAAGSLARPSPDHLLLDRGHLLAEPLELVGHVFLGPGEHLGLLLLDVVLDVLHELLEGRVVVLVPRLHPAQLLDEVLHPVVLVLRLLELVLLLLRVHPLRCLGDGRVENLLLHAGVGLELPADLVDDLLLLLPGVVPGLVVLLEQPPHLLVIRPDDLDRVGPGVLLRHRWLHAFLPRPRRERSAFRGRKVPRSGGSKNAGSNGCAGENESGKGAPARILVGTPSDEAGAVSKTTLRELVEFDLRDEPRRSVSGAEPDARRWGARARRAGPAAREPRSPASAGREPTSGGRDDQPARGAALGPGLGSSRAGLGPCRSAPPIGM